MAEDQTRVQIDRPAYTQSQLDDAYKRRETVAPSRGQTLKQLARKCRPSPYQFAQAVLGLFPFLGHLKSYRNKWKQNLAGDIIAGITVGVMHIPMGMGFALLANVPPIYGLYTGFWCVVLYFIFGQSPHMSFGSMAIMSIMVSEATSPPGGNNAVVTNGNNQSQQGLRITDPLVSANKTSPFYEMMMNSTDGNQLKPAPDNTMEIVGKTMAVTFLTGIVMVAMSILKLSKIVSFIPVSCITGFTTAAAFHIVTSQLKFLLGVSIPGHKGIFKLVKLWREIALELPNTNVCDLIISICCLMFLFLIKEIINPKYRHKLPVPIPAEMIVIIVVTPISYLCKLNSKYGIQILDESVSGFAAPVVPDLKGFQDYLVDACMIALISFLLSYSMISTFSRKHKYEVSISQELLAYGMCHMVGSIFGGFVSAAAPPRCTVLDTTGAKTQVVHIFSSAVLLLTILVLGPLFEPLPNSSLSAIICCALIPLFKQFLLLVQYWKINKYDFAIWLVTWASVVFLDIDIGLAIGVLFSITTIVVQSCTSSGMILSTTGHPDLPQPQGKHEVSEEAPGIKIFKFESSLHFASVAQFKDQLFSLAANPQRLQPKSDKTKDEEEKPKELQSENSVKKGINDVYTIKNEHGGDTDRIAETLCPELDTIILDFSGISYIDVMGLNLIKQLQGDYSHVGISLVLANCTNHVLRKLEAAGIGSAGDSGSGDHVECEIQIYPTIQDAIIANYKIPKTPKEENANTK